MNKSEAERLIVEEMRKILPTIPYTGADGGLAQYLSLKSKRPELFEFRSGVSDQWTLVSGWLKKHRLVA
jgi:hypothetical protein